MKRRSRESPREEGRRGEQRERNGICITSLFVARRLATSSRENSNERDKWRRTHNRPCPRPTQSNRNAHVGGAFLTVCIRGYADRNEPPLHSSQRRDGVERTNDASPCLLYFPDIASQLIARMTQSRLVSRIFGREVVETKGGREYPRYFLYIFRN